MTDGAEIHARPKIVGARIKRTEDPRLLSGTGAFADDRQTPRVLHVAFRRSEHSHAHIKAIDCGAARKADGVVAVFTAEDLAATVAPLLATSRMKGYHATPILPLARGKVRYVGEPVVGIVAQSRYLAEDALEMIGIEFEPLPVVIDPLEAVKEDAPRLHEEAGGNIIVSREFKRGDVDAALAGAAVRVRDASACTARRRWRLSRAPVSPNTTPVDARLPYIRQHRCPASCGTRLLPRSTYAATTSAWSPPMSAADSVARARSIRRRFSFARRRVCSAVRSNGPATVWKT